MSKSKYKMNAKTCHSSLPLLAVLLLGAAVFSTSRAEEIDSVCDNIAAFFNALNQVMPLHATIPAAQTDSGLSYSEGTITFTQVAKSLKNCKAYPIKGSTIVRIRVASAITINLPNFMDIANEVNLEADEVTIELHYQISQSDNNDQTSMVSLKPIMTEVREMGKVQIDVQGGENNSFTDQAEDILRPLLFTVADRFAKESLNFQIEPKTYDPTGAAYDAFKTIFKAYMYNQHTNTKH